MTQVTLRDLTKKYSSQVKAVDHLSLEIPAGKITAILGPSGCGKTTLLKLIAGLVPPTSGDIFFDGISQLNIPAEKRGAVMVFQNHLLFPFLSVGDNVAFGLKMRGEPPQLIREQVLQILELVQLAGYEKRQPSQLSGGQQQRAALARALITQPRILLLDEPLSNLDANLREEMRELIFNLQRQQGITTVFVTHDQEEAVMLADQIALVFEGVLQQVGEPRAFYERPANLATARFFGANNILPGFAREGRIDTASGCLQIEANQMPPGPVNLVIRPENIQIVTEKGDGNNIIVGRVRSCTFAGTRTRMKITVEGALLEVVTDASPLRCYQEGETILLFLPPANLWAYPATEPLV